MLLLAVTSGSVVYAIVGGDGPEDVARKFSSSLKGATESSRKSDKSASELIDEALSTLKS